jgi:uncharacterized protein (TIGR03067 family)
MRVAAGEPVPDGLLSAGAAALSEGMKTSMSWTKTKIALTLLALVAVCTGITVAANHLLREVAKHGAPAPKSEKDGKEKETKEEAAVKELQGRWKVAGLEAEGKKAGADDVKGMSWTFDGKKITGKDAHGTTKMSFTLRPDKDPKEIDLLGLDGEGKGKTAEGIYKLEKGVLTICLRDPANANKGRPKEFSTEANSGLGIITLEKEKK